MANPYFEFQQFKVYHDRCAMKVGTDGVLLGAWADASKAEMILDVGTGSGLIALMLAQRFSATVHAIDIDEPSCEQAMHNVEASPWSNRMNVRCSSFASFASLHAGSYDCVVSNPPFFTDSLQAEDARRHRARHNDSLSPGELLEHSKKVLRKQGLLHVIYPPEEAEFLVELAMERGWSVARRCVVFSKPGKPVRRVLLSLLLGQTECEESQLTLETDERHVHTDAYAALTRNFYLRYREHND